MKRITRNILWILLASLSMGAALTNCQSDERSNQVTNNTATSDSAIVAQIESKMKNEPLLKDVSIGISSSYGSVVLSGLVDTDLQAGTIVTLVQSNQWVKDVDAKNLKVKDSNIPLIDTYTTAKVKGALIRDKLLDVMNPGAIQVETKNKVVYLSGEIANQTQKDKISDSVKSVRGVDAIKNGLTIKQ